MLVEGIKQHNCAFVNGIYRNICRFSFENKSDCSVCNKQDAIWHFGGIPVFCILFSKNLT